MVSNRSLHLVSFLCQDLVIQLRDRLNSRKKKNQLVEQDLTAARDQMKRKTLELREQLTRTQKEARKQLVDLSVQGHNATKRLEAVIAKVRPLSACCQLSAVCSRSPCLSVGCRGRRF